MLVTGDTHNLIDYRKLLGLPAGEIVLIAGDFGAYFSGLTDSTLVSILKELDNEFLFCDGNHDNFDVLYSLPEINRHGAKVHKLADNIYHLKRGEIYTIEDKKVFVFGGGYSIDKARRIEGVSWWRLEMPKTIEYDNGLDNLAAERFKVDIILTHTAPTSVKMKLIDEMGIYYKVAHEEEPLNRFLEEVANLVEFDQWFFGHFHVDRDLESPYGVFRALYNDVVEVA